MVKWIDEKVLQLYFKENYHKYKVRIEGEDKKITRCDFNTPFDTFPDLICFIDNKEYPVEVEWLSSRYNHFNHPDHQKYVDQGLFLVVFDKDIEVGNFKQIVVDKKDFKSWFRKNSGRIFDESVKTYKKEVLKKRKYPKIWVVYLGKAMAKNFKVGINKGIWGFTEGRYKLRVPPIVNQIQKNDIVLFFGPTSNGPPDFSPRLEEEKFYNLVKKNKKLKIDNIIAFKVTQDYWSENENKVYDVVWPDENLQNKKYPHRFLFSKKPMFSFKDVPFYKIAKPTINSLRRIMISSPDEIDYPHFIEIISNFTFS